MSFEHRNVVTVWPDAESIRDEDGGLEIETDFISLYDANTHGPPALVAPGRSQGERVPPTVQVGQEVLYISTAAIPMFSIKRVR